MSAAASAEGRLLPEFFLALHITEEVDGFVMFEISEIAPVTLGPEATAAEAQSVADALRDTSLPRDMVIMMWDTTLMIGERLTLIMIMITNPGPVQGIMTMSQVVTKQGDLHTQMKNMARDLYVLLNKSLRLLRMILMAERVSLAIRQELTGNRGPIVHNQNMHHNLVTEVPLPPPLDTMPNSTLRKHHRHHHRASIVTSDFF